MYVVAVEKSNRQLTKVLQYTQFRGYGETTGNRTHYKVTVGNYRNYKKLKGVSPPLCLGSALFKCMHGVLDLVHWCSTR